MVSLVVDIDNTLFSFSGYVKKLLNGKKDILEKEFPNISFRNPFSIYDFVIGDHNDKIRFFRFVFEYMKNHNDVKYNTCIEMLDYVYEKLAPNDVYIVTNRSDFMNINEVKEWFERELKKEKNNLKNISKKILDKIYLYNTDQRLDLIQELNQKEQKVIYIDDNPSAIQKFFTRNLETKNALFVPLWEYNYMNYEIKKRVTTCRKSAYIPHSFCVNYKRKDIDFAISKIILL